MIQHALKMIELMETQAFQIYVCVPTTGLDDDNDEEKKQQKICSVHIDIIILLLIISLFLFFFQFLSLRSSSFFLQTLYICGCVAHTGEVDLVCCLHRKRANNNSIMYFAIICHKDVLQNPLSISVCFVKVNKGLFVVKQLFESFVTSDDSD